MYQTISTDIEFMILCRRWVVIISAACTPLMMHWKYVITVLHQDTEFRILGESEPLEDTWCSTDNFSPHMPAQIIVGSLTTLMFYGGVLLVLKSYLY